MTTHESHVGIQGDLLDGRDLEPPATFEAHGIDGCLGSPVAPLPSLEPRMLDDAMWVPTRSASAPDTHAAFRGKFSLEVESTVTLRVFAVTAFQLWIDADRSIDGPLRFAPSYPEYQVVEVSLPAGDHVLAVHVRADGLTTRINANLAGLWWCEIDDGRGVIDVSWRCRQLTEYRRTDTRISLLLAWVEWTDRWLDPRWRGVDFDDDSWLRPVDRERRAADPWQLSRSKVSCRCGRALPSGQSERADIAIHLPASS